jgi:transcription elongation factor/antiterminator RfaH
LTRFAPIVPSDAGAAPWYAVALQPHADALARAHLTRQGFAVFAPTLQRTVRHARQFITKPAPLFPGYLFIALELGRDRWRAVNGTRGVRGLLTAGDRPAQVPAAVIEELRAAEAASAALPEGATLEVVAGPFTGLMGTLQRLDGGARVYVLLQLIGAERAVSLERAAVRRVG